MSSERAIRAAEQHRREEASSPVSVHRNHDIDMTEKLCECC
jgi:hypothetical protein